MADLPSMFADTAAKSSEAHPVTYGIKLDSGQTEDLKDPGTAKCCTETARPTRDGTGALRASG
jgi:hypothetical protein